MLESIMDYAEIIESVHDIPLPGGGIRSYMVFRWQGKRTWPVQIHKEIEDYIPSLPWKLRLIDFEPARDICTYQRKDGILWLWSLLSWVRCRFGLYCSWWYARFICTLMIWGLAYIPPGAAPSRRHIGKKRNA